MVDEEGVWQRVRASIALSVPVLGPLLVIAIVVVPLIDPACTEACRSWPQLEDELQHGIVACPCSEEQTGVAI